MSNVLTQARTFLLTHARLLERNIFAVAFEGADHPWLSRATQTAVEILIQETPKEAHTLLGATRLARQLGAAGPGLQAGMARKDHTGRRPYAGGLQTTVGL